MFWLIWSLVTLSVIGNGYLYLKEGKTTRQHEKTSLY